MHSYVVQNTLKSVNNIDDGQVMLRNYRNLYHHAEIRCFSERLIIYIITLIILIKVLNILLRVCRLLYFIEDKMIVVNVNIR